MTEFPAMVSPDSPSSSRDTARLVEEEGREAGTSNFWSLNFYQQLFDIDTVDVRNRYIYSLCKKKLDKDSFDISMSIDTLTKPYFQVDVQHVASSWEILPSASHQTQV